MKYITNQNIGYQKPHKKCHHKITQDAANNQPKKATTTKRKMMREFEPNKTAIIIISN